MTPSGLSGPVSFYESSFVISTAVAAESASRFSVPRTRKKGLRKGALEKRKRVLDLERDKSPSARLPYLDSFKPTDRVSEQCFQEMLGR